MQEFFYPESDNIRTMGKTAFVGLGCKNGLILPTGQWYAPSAVINDAWYCMVLKGNAWYCMVLHIIAWYCMVLHGIAW